jgi:hypothetical protein
MSEDEARVAAVEHVLELRLAAVRDVAMKVQIQHQRIPLFDGTQGQRCVGCDALRGATDGPNSPRHAAHVAEQIAVAIGGVA